MTARKIWLGILAIGITFIPVIGHVGTGTGNLAVATESAANSPMTNGRLDELIRRIDSEAKGGVGAWQLVVEKHTIVVVTEEKADRMRIMTGISKVDGLDITKLYRLMQANFDSALDARYAIADNILWGAFIHPLSPLSDAEFLSGLGQVVNLAETYGTTYSSGALVFRGGDSRQLQRRQLIDRLLKQGQGI